MRDAQRPSTLELAIEQIYVLKSMSAGANAAGSLVRQLRREMEAVAAKTASLKPPRVLFLESVHPTIPGSGWKRDLLRVAGAVAATEVVGSLSARDVAGADPDAIIVAIPGVSLSDALELVEVLVREPEWIGLRAVRNGIVAVLDGVRLLGQPSATLAEAAAVLAYCLHGDRSRIDVSESDDYQEVFWPGASWLELPNDFGTWAEGRRFAHQRAHRIITEHAIEAAEASFESFRRNRELVVPSPSEGVIGRAREASVDVTDHENLYYQTFFSVLNRSGFDDRLRRRMRARLAGTRMDKEAAIEAVTEVLAIHDPIGITHYPDTEEYSLEGKAIVSVAAGEGRLDRETVTRIVQDVLIRYFGEFGTQPGLDALVSDIAAALAHSDLS